MPLQHINDGMLKRMHRLGDKTALTDLVARIRQRIPGVMFRTAFIVGFPGESDAAFQELHTFVSQSEFDRVAVFLYSDEEGTSAVHLDGKIERVVMEERRNELLAVQEAIASSKERQRIGQTLEVLIDGHAEEGHQLLEGRHEGLAPEIDGVVFIRKDAGRGGEFVKIRITDAIGYDLVGESAESAEIVHPPHLLYPAKTSQGYR
jgi:ribosomal protein S12 methylthiotransferase